MGQEALCKVEYNGQSATGRAHLETNEILFRGDFRLVIPRADVRAAEVSDGALRIAWPKGEAVFHLGAAAPKWAQKILYPPSRLDKLGVKSGTTYQVLGVADSDFLAELAACGAQSRPSGADLVFLCADNKADLKRLNRIADQVVWIVYPKGVQTITENDVISAGRKAGRKDIKVASFSASKTALKFVIPA